MEQSRMLAAGCPPWPQPSGDAGTTGTETQHSAGSTVTGRDAKFQSSSEHRGQQKHSGDFAEQRNGALTLQLPPIALSFSPDELTTTELAPIQPPHEKSAASSGRTLPPLSSLTGAQAPHHVSLSNPPEASQPAPYAKATNHWPSLNPFTAYYSPSHLEPVEPAGNVDSERNHTRRSASVSLDDPDVRMAAEALGHLRTGTSAGSSMIPVAIVLTLCFPYPQTSFHRPANRTHPCPRQPPTTRRPGTTRQPLLR